MKELERQVLGNGVSSTYLVSLYVFNTIKSQLADFHSLTDHKGKLPFVKQLITSINFAWSPPLWLLFTSPSQKHSSGLVLEFLWYDSHDENKESYKDLNKDTSDYIFAPSTTFKTTHYCSSNLFRFKDILAINL